MLHCINQSALPLFIVDAFVFKRQSGLAILQPGNVNLIILTAFSLSLSLFLGIVEVIFFTIKLFVKTLIIVLII